MNSYKQLSSRDLRSLGRSPRRRSPSTRRAKLEQLELRSLLAADAGLSQQGLVEVIAGMDPAAPAEIASAQAQGFGSSSLQLGSGGTDIGNPGLAGSASYQAGVWTVRGGGSDIWNTADQFHFISQSLRGDGAVVAQVTSVSNSNPWAKAGVMLRSSEAADAAYADVVVTPANGVVFQYRTAAGAAAVSVSAEGIAATPIWVKLTRTAERFAAAFSYDGANWVQIGDAVTIQMGSAAQAGLAVSAGNNAALCTATFRSVNIVPVGWTASDIGNPGVAGFTEFEGSTLIAAGSGSDIYGSSDQFHFVSQSFVGDLSITAKVNSLSNTGNYAKAGVMIRDGTSVSAAYAFMFFNPTTGVAGQGANFEFRGLAGAATQSGGSVPNVTAPNWVRLVRSGNTFTAYRSHDGTNWTQVGPSTTIAMPTTIKVGVAVSANNNAALNPASFSNLSVTPVGWSDADIGAPPIAGSSRFDGLAWSVAGNGADVWNASDQFHFVSQTIAGDVTLVARVNGLLNTGTYAKAGLMIRDGAGADASFAFSFLNPYTAAPFTGASFEYRNGRGMAAQGAGFVTGVQAPAWLKLVRSGNVFTGFHSVDGELWVQSGASVTIGMGATVQVGLAVNSNSATGLNTATFDSVQIGSRVIDPMLKAVGPDFRNDRGTGDDVNLRGTNLGGWLLHENWINQLDSSGLPDDVSVHNTLESRFGVATANRALAAFEDNWITELDLDNIKALGLNVLRVPFSYRNVLNANLNWRTDAFTQLDWVVDEAWKRGIYVILDLHGAPGGASPFMSSGTLNGGALWTDANLQTKTVDVWTGVAEHFANHPGIAAYDLLNEPVPPSYDAVWTQYDRLYDAIRAVDSAHVVMMEGSGGQGVGNSYWNLDSLPDPSWFGWTNIAYQTHAYALDGGASGEGTANWQVQQFHDRSYFNVPMLIGEFNLGDRDDYGVQLWDDNNLNWTSWTYKMTDWVGNNWGIYGVSGQWPWSPNLQTYPAAQIISDYATKTTAGHFALNPSLRSTFGTPTVVPDSFDVVVGSPRYVAPASGVLANDTNPNAGQPGNAMHAILVDSTAHGALTLWDDGSFNYVPAAGFVGTDTFRYRVWDGHNDSGNLGVVRLVVEPPPLPAGWSNLNIGATPLVEWAGFNANSGIWTVAGSGTDIWVTSDQFAFARRSLSGDATLTARVIALDNTNPWAKAGIMLRRDDRPDSPFVDVSLTPSNGLIFEYRSATGVAAGGTTVAGITGPIWLKLTRTSNTFTASYSSNGAAWTQIGAPQTISLGNPILAGLAVTSHDPAALNLATFSNVSVQPVRTVVGQNVFYDNSKFDGNAPGLSAQDDAAIATDKQALFAGQTASIANYTSYSRGINGIFIDLAGAAGLAVTAADFEFRVGNTNAISQWAAAPVPTSISIRAGAGLNGADRVAIHFADRAIKNQWLQVIVKATTATGLATPYMFYFGNAVGEAGNSVLNATVNGTDEIATRGNPKTFVAPATISNRFDFNRDGLVNATDQILARSNATTLATSLTLLAPLASSQSSAAASLQSLAQSNEDMVTAALLLGNNQAQTQTGAGLSSIGSGPMFGATEAVFQQVNWEDRVSRTNPRVDYSRSTGELLACESEMERRQAVDAEWLLEDLLSSLDQWKT